MNDKIKELALQAGYVPLPGADFANSLQEVFMQKFAELIVRECLDACNENNKSYYAHVGIAACVKSIRQRFGVE